ncbi:arabinan endo-1,5-alpha-L-arabinosidase [Streptomyces sp. N2-109]|uniref:Arabinan endo-1,5-alpha-L-arabinosidase n=1 Tax=Streptomyces gossypii TaxID=2883101 RepID=A0ABT2JZ64_9ACTN|nr:arabinan endo-1,5-alpha-L-arabinosidase [Streptomyces gossypii]MCT2593202.1 arabinan endo-1,5-alpha-L-arabinosidase [Streptomyces gossypii]
MAAVLAFTLMPGSASAAYPPPGLLTGDISVHDPSMVKTDSGYVLYSTHNGLEARTSTDRTAFRRSGSAFNRLPDWWTTYSSEKDPWAPDVSRHGGRYLMYYSVSSFGSNHSAIGLATSATGEPGSWSDQGILHSTTESSHYNAIDPNLFVDDDGKWWLSFGSWSSGIKMMRLDPSTGKRHAQDRTLHSLASRPTGTKAVEGPAVVKHGRYYYLFASYDRCCAGTSSTYKIKVGRAGSPTGPYTDRNGVPMMRNGGTEVLGTHGRYIGPGGQSVLHDEDGDLLVYHYYDRERNGAPTLGVNLLDWSSGWPVAY